MGSPDNEEAIYPNFIEIARGFGVPARRVIKREDLREGIQEMLNTEGPFLLEVVVPHTDHVMPMIPQGKSAKEILIK
jgi:acetolactate synthase-1/2/3 large subunit